MSKTCGVKKIGNHEYYCSVELTLGIVGGKWKPIILYHLGDGAILRFGELKKKMHSITQKMLTRQLRELEADGVVHRKVYPEVPPKVEYSLTELGKTLTPLMKQLCAWGKEYEKLMTDQGDPEAIAS